MTKRELPPINDQIREKVAAGISHAILRDIQPQSSGMLSREECEFCGEAIIFAARSRAIKRGLPVVKLINKIYIDGKWSYQTQAHVSCYEQADQPYGEPLDGRNILANGSKKSVGRPKKQNEVEPEVEVDFVRTDELQDLL